MRAAVLREPGGPDALTYEEIDDPACAADAVLVRIEAISLEGGDLRARQRRPTLIPHVIGYAAAGEVLQAGSAVNDALVGQKVATFNFAGSHAEVRAVPASYCWPIPRGLDVRAAAGVPIAFGTAHDCLFEYGHLEAGETVLVQGGSGGVGIAAIQLAKRAGARVIATASTTERLTQLRPYGLDEGIDYRTADIRETVQQLTGGRGVDVVVDLVGGPTLQTSILCLAEAGRVLTVGRAGGDAPKVVNVDSMTQKRNSLIGVFLGAELATARVHAMIRELLEDTASGELKMAIDRSFPLREAAAAHRYAEGSGRGVGRVLLIPEAGRA